MSNHNKFIYKLDNNDCIYRTKGNSSRFEVLQYNRLKYTTENIDKLAKDGRKMNPTDDLISNGFRKGFPPEHPRWTRKYFGSMCACNLCFSLFYGYRFTYCK